MAEPTLHVECYSGYKADERPVRLYLADRRLEVVAVDDRWHSPGATFFRVVVEDGDRYVLRHEEPQDVWTIAGYRARVGQFVAARGIATAPAPSSGVAGRPA